MDRDYSIALSTKANILAGAYNQYDKAIEIMDEALKSFSKNQENFDFASMLSKKAGILEMA